jgi:hypothetical protein
MCSLLPSLIERFFDHHLLLMFHLGRVKKYSRIVRDFQPMMSIIPSDNTFATLCQLHPLPSVPVLPLLFYYELEHTFVLNRILFTWSLVTTPHLSSGGLSRMVYKHLLGCFTPKDPSSWFSELFQSIVVVAHGDIPRSMALVLGLIDC